MKTVSTEEYILVLKELVEEGREVSLKIAGNSMSPFLSHERDVIYFKKPDRNLKKGDMVFYQRKSGRYIMHRIWKVDGNQYYLVGDAQREIEGPIERNQIFALITKAKRKGKMTQKGDFWWEFFEHIWIRIVPYRRSLIKLYQLFKNA